MKTHPLNNFHFEDVLSSHALARDERRRRIVLFFRLLLITLSYSNQLSKLISILQQLDDCVKSVMENV